MEKQNEFLFPEGATTSIELPDLRAGFYCEVAKIWHLPLGQSVHIELQKHDLTEISGPLELNRAPELPLNSREPLHLCVGKITFLSTQVLAWSAIG